MKHGETLIKVRVSGEPCRLFVDARSTLHSARPERAAVTIVKTRRRRSDWSSDFGLHWISRNDRKLADNSVSQLATRMNAEEIGAARKLIDLLANWLDGKTPVPRLDREILNAVVSIELAGDAALMIAEMERLNLPEIVSSVWLGPVYMQGQPRYPDARWLPPIESSNVTVAQSETRHFDRMLRAGHPDEIAAYLKRISAIFRHKADLRRKLLRTRAKDVMGDNAERWLTTRDRYRGAPIESVESDFDFEAALSVLENEARKVQAHKPKVRTWHAA